MQSIIIATRESRLALWQARHVAERLRAASPGRNVSLLGMTTRGDQVLDRPLASIGGKGLFTKELEIALLEGRAHLAVHSLKDVPMVLGEEFVLAAVLEREDPRDAFVSNHYASLEALPNGARLGSSSVRRTAQLLARYPHLTILPCRGNLDTRLRKLDAGEYDAILLASAGLKRLGLADRIRAVLPQSEALPAPAQGVLGIEIRADDTATAAAVTKLDHLPTRLAISAERALALELGGSCKVPLAAYCEEIPSQPSVYRLRAQVASVDGRQVVNADASMPLRSVAQAQAFGHQLALQMRQDGAAAILAALTA
jgi:hydroxymethylbilane synthase